MTRSKEMMLEALKARYPMHRFELVGDSLMIDGEPAKVGWFDNDTVLYERPTFTGTDTPDPRPVLCE
jgi:hypothetical protein